MPQYTDQYRGQGETAVGQSQDPRRCAEGLGAVLKERQMCEAKPLQTALLLCRARTGHGCVTGAGSRLPRSDCESVRFKVCVYSVQRLW